MNTLYLIISNDEITIKTRISDILKKHKLDKEIIKIDLEDNPIDNLLEELDTYSLFDETKVVVGYNASFLSSSKKIDNDSIDLLEKYINNPSNNIMILVTDKIDSKKKIVKLLKEKADVLEEEISSKTIITNNLEDYKMDINTINYLVTYCDGNNEKIINELNKLKLYKMDEKIITKEDIENIVLKTVSDNIFNLVDAICLREKTKAFNIYKELISNGEEIIKIISVLEEQFRIMYNGRLLLKDNRMSNDEAAKVLGVHPYRFKKAIEASRLESIKSIFNKLYDLTGIEVDIKTGNNPFISFELFICSL